MYKDRDDVSNLVKSLSSGEKRYFSKFSRAFASEGKPALYLQLFQLLEKGKSEVSNEFKENSPRALSTAKKLLYDNILRAMRCLNDNNSIDITIQSQLSEVEILYKLSLPSQGLNLIRKVGELARFHEKFGLLLQVLEWEKRLNIVLVEPSRPTDAIVAEEREILRKMMQIMNLESLYGKIMNLKKQYGYARGDARLELERETIHAPEMPAVTDCLSDRALFYHNFIYAQYHWMVFEHKQAYEFSKSLLNLGKKSILPNDYIGALLQHITSSVCLGHFKDTLNGIQLGEAYIEEYRLNQSHSFRSLMFTYHATYELIVHNYMGELGKLRDAVYRIEAKLKQYDKILPFEHKQIILGNLMNAYMGCGELENADRIWDSMFNRQSQTVRRDIYADLFLFRLFRLLQDKTYSLLPSSAQSALRYYRKFEDCKEVFEVEMPVAMLLQKERNNYEKKEVLRELLEQIKAIVERFIMNLNGVNNFQEHYTRYIIWCDSILSDVPYHETAQKWYNDYCENERQKHLFNQPL